MLILSRKPGDAILIDGGIRIVVLASDQRAVRIGIEAPTKIGILREEIALPAGAAEKLVRVPPRRPAPGRVRGRSGPGELRTH